MTHYPATFRTYLVQGIEHLLTQVAVFDGQLPEHLCRQAFHVFTYSFKMENAWPLTRQLLLHLAPKLTLSAIPNEWLLYLNAALELSQAKNDTYTTGKLHLYAGYVDQRNGNLGIAKNHYEQAVFCFAELNNDRELAWSLSRLANIQRMLNDSANAQHNAEKSIALLSDADPYRVLPYMVLGWIAYDESNWGSSQHYFEQALHLTRVSGDKQREAHLLRDLGSVLQMQGQFSQAIEYYLQSITLLDNLHDDYDRAIAEMNLGVVYLYLEQWQSAQTWLAKAHPNFQNFNDNRYLGMSYTNQAIALRGLQKFEDALTLLQTSVALFEQIEDAYGVANGLDEIGLTLLQNHQVSKAKKVFKSALKKLPSTTSNANYQKKSKEITEHLEGCKTYS